MSGGYVLALKKFRHQIVTLTFKGPITEEELKDFNDAFEKLKLKLGARMIAVTVQGDPTPKGREGRPMDDDD